MNIEERKRIKTHYSTLADMGRFNYATFFNNDVTYVFEVEQDDRDIYPFLAQDGVSHILIYYIRGAKGHYEYEMETLELLACTRAVTSLLGIGVPQADTRLPVDFGAEITFISPE